MGVEPLAIHRVWCDPLGQHPPMRTTYQHKFLSLSIDDYMSPPLPGPVKNERKEEEKRQNITWRTARLPTVVRKHRHTPTSVTSRACKISTQVISVTWGFAIHAITYYTRALISPQESGRPSTVYPQNQEEKEPKDLQPSKLSPKLDPASSNSLTRSRHLRRCGFQNWNTSMFQGQLLSI